MNAAGSQYSVIRTQQSLLGTQYSVLSTRIRPFLGLAAILMTLAGCSYEPKFPAGTRAVGGTRSLKQLGDELLVVMADLKKTLADAKDEKSAKEAMPKIDEEIAKFKALLKEAYSGDQRVTAEEKKAFETDFIAKAGNYREELTAVLASLTQRGGTSAELAKKYIDGMLALKQTVESGKINVAESGASPGNPPDSSGWMMWLLCLVVMAACVGFLCRDGLWSNAIRLVNVVLAGLLAMNFYEWAANWITNYSGRLPSLCYSLRFSRLVGMLRGLHGGLPHGD